jgi:hypothetical protein
MADKCGRTLRVSDRDNPRCEYDQDQTKTPDSGSLDPLGWGAAILRDELGELLRLLQTPRGATLLHSAFQANEEHGHKEVR